MWEQNLSFTSTLLLVDGRLLVREPDAVVAPDARDGTVLWDTFVTAASFFYGRTVDAPTERSSCCTRPQRMAPWPSPDT